MAIWRIRSKSPFSSASRYSFCACSFSTSGKKSLWMTVWRPCQEGSEPGSEQPTGFPCLSVNQHTCKDLPPLLSPAPTSVQPSDTQSLGAFSDADNIPCGLAATSDITKLPSVMKPFSLRSRTGHSHSHSLASLPHQLDQCECCHLHANSDLLLPTQTLYPNDFSRSPHHRHQLSPPTLHLQPDLAPQLHICAPSCSLMPLGGLPN